MINLTARMRHLIPQEELTEPLSPVELQRLHAWKLRYVLEYWGFAEPQISRLMFLRWLHEHGRVAR